MELLNQIVIPRPEGDASIELVYGDLTAIPKGFAVDILAISAFRGDYRTNHDTLMHDLFNAGISVAELANNKEIDLINQLSCWLSKPLTAEQQLRFNIKQILCFEPIGTVNDVETQVGNLFRAINTFALDDNHNEIAMPILTTGDRHFPIEAMLPALLDVAIFWLESGLPLKSLRLVLHRTEQVQKSLPIFENARQHYEAKKEVAESADNLEITRDFNPNAVLELPVQPTGYDYFISYSHKHTAAVHEFVDALKARNPQFTIFYDRDTIPPGGLWIKMISDAIQNSRNVICILTPEYSQSAVCWDEFQCAYIMEKRKKLMIRTINFRNDIDLPPMMAMYSYIDCTEGDLEKLKQAVDELVNH